LPGDIADINENPITVPSAKRLSLVVAAGTREERTLLCRRVVTLIGARTGCKVVLSHRRVAPVHLALINEGTRVVAVDLVTKHGSLLNGLALKHEVLSDGDVITIQKSEFRVRIEEPALSDGADAHPFPLDESPNVALEHAATHQVFQPRRDVCIIGRRPGCDIVLPDPDVSRVHALLLTYFAQPAVFDLLSINHTCVADEPVRFRLLAKDDLLAVGPERFHVRYTNKSVGRKARIEARPSEEAEPLRTVDLIEPVNGDDLVNIHQTESAQRWRIADKLEKLAKPRPAAT
jgi:pSer/pThr/pTyr-binding forkhead associated (FHA) protein